MEKKISFASDYMEGAHPEIMRRLMETNLEKSAGYGLDTYSEAAREKIRTACHAPEAEVFFLAGGTQTNRTVIDAFLKPYQGVIAAETGHISVHEAGAIESGGHKVLTVPHTDGKLKAEDVRRLMEAYWKDDSRGHLVMPGMVYLSHPTEYGTLYTLEEMEALSALCREYDLSLYLDGARLAYALACPENKISLADIARLCDVFYIGGTKCGALFGEAVVIPEKDRMPHFFSIIKQHGALLAKGRIAGLQFDTLFTDNLYHKIGENGIRTADSIRHLLGETFDLCYGSPTNQIFVAMTQKQRTLFEEHQVEAGFWESLPDDRMVMRFVTSWATTDEDVDALRMVVK